jgi:hypothetical protein
VVIISCRLDELVGVLVSCGGMGGIDEDDSSALVEFGPERLEVSVSKAIQPAIGEQGGPIRMHLIEIL